MPVYIGVSNMTSIQENKNVEKISMVKPTEAKGGGRGGGVVTYWFRFCFPLFDFHLSIFLFGWDFGFYFLTLISFFFLTFYFLPIYFVLLFSFFFAFKLYNENQKQNQNRQSRPSCFAGRSIWRIKVSIRRSAALLTMLAQVNFLILPPLIALNHKLYFFSTYLLILLFKLGKSR